MNIERIVKETFNKVLNENAQKDQYFRDNVNRDVQELVKMSEKFLNIQNDRNLAWLVWYCKNFVQKYNNKSIGRQEEPKL